MKCFRSRVPSNQLVGSLYISYIHISLYDQALFAQKFQVGMWLQYVNDVSSLLWPHQCRILHWAIMKISMCENCSEDDILSKFLWFSFQIQDQGSIFTEILDNRSSKIKDHQVDL